MEPAKSSRTLGVIVIAVWMILNLVLLALMIPGDLPDINNYIEVALWIAAAAGLLSMRKAGAAFAIAVLCITLSTSMGNVLLAYYYNVIGEPVAYVNALRIALNAVAIIYMFKQIFTGKFR